MVLSGPTNSAGGPPQVPQSLLRQNSIANQQQQQQQFNSLVSPRTQFTANGGNHNLSMLTNIPNVSSFLNHTMSNGVEHNQLFQNQPVHPLGNNASQQMDAMQTMQSFQQQFSMQNQNMRSQLSEGQLRSVKLEPQMGSVKMEMQQIPQQELQMQQVQLQQMQMPPVKLERQQSESGMMMQMSRQQNPVIQMGLLQQQQRMMHVQQQQQQQQQVMKGRGQFPQMQLQQVRQQNGGVAGGVSGAGRGKAYEPGTCARRLTCYMYHQQHRPEDNSIEYWRKFVAEFFAPNAKKRWCVSMYGNNRQTTGVFPQDVWHCEICNRKPGRGFETTVEVLPRLYQIKYASGTQEELLYIDMPREYQNASGQIVLDYAKAVQESVFEQLRVVREGQLRIVFAPDLKIYSWEFCARRHEELIPRRSLIPQVNQLGAVLQNYQSSMQNGSPCNLSTQDLQNTCNSFVASARQMAKALDVPLVNDLGYTKRYVRCLQISEVVNSMKDLIDYSRETSTGPMDSLINYPKRSGAPSTLPPQQQLRQQQQQQQQHYQQPPNDAQTIAMQSGPHATDSSAITTCINTSGSTGAVSTTNHSFNTHSTTTSVSGLNQITTAPRDSPYGNPNPNPHPDHNPNPVQIPSASSSNMVQPTQLNPSSPFPSPTPSTSNNMVSTPQNNGVNPGQAHEPDLTETQSSVQQILQDMIMSSQLKGLAGDTKVINNGSNNCVVGNGPINNGGVGQMGFGVTRVPMANNVISLNGRVGMNSMNGINPSMSRDLMGMNQAQTRQHDAGNSLLNGLAPINGFSNMQFDWKMSP